MTNLPVVAIVGRPNVGKSAIFNRFLGRRRAIVHEQAGVTRDRVVAACDYDGRHFLLVDTGGLGVFPGERKGVESFDTLIREQVEAVLKEAAAVIFVTDSQAGLTPLDGEIAAFLRRQGVRVVVAGNKTDAPEKIPAAVAAFTPLGFHVEAVSAVHGLGIGDLLLEATRDLPRNEAELRAAAETAPLRLAVVGRPNAGKSSLVNCLAGHRRMIVSEIPGTTRDAVDVPVELTTPAGAPLPAVIVDTAGLRPRHKVDSLVEKFSVMRAEHAIRHADIILFLVDASAPPTAQDRRIANLIGEARKPCLLVANKSDLLPKGTKPAALERGLRQEMPFMDYVPLVAISAKTGRGLEELRGRIARLQEKLQTTIPTAILNQFLRDLVARTPPPAVKGRHLKLFYCTMVSTPPPHLVMFVNHKELGSRAYTLFLESRARDAFFPEGGMPVTVEMRNRSQKAPAERAGAGAGNAQEQTPNPELSPGERRRRRAAATPPRRRREFRGRGR
ncbi:MAG: ribosome biogenesis GTPase Der [Lentisphaeria bacterium]|jgi:GTP-binding protein